MEVRGQLGFLSTMCVLEVELRASAKLSSRHLYPLSHPTCPRRTSYLSVHFEVCVCQRQRHACDVRRLLCMMDRGPGYCSSGAVHTVILRKDLLLGPEACQIHPG